jgi:cysteine synthase
LFEHVTEVMNDEEEDIAGSTPSYQVMVGPQASPPRKQVPAQPHPMQTIEPEPEALKLVENIITDEAEPVVMFALEWCEFCWALRKFFAEYNIPYRSVDIDSAQYQKDNVGTKIRTALHKITGTPTIPQVFIGGKHVGGCTETLEFFKQGRLRPQLEACNIACDFASTRDPYDFLPKWVHPRQ